MTFSTPRNSENQEQSSAANGFDLILPSYLGVKTTLLDVPHLEVYDDGTGPTLDVVKNFGHDSLLAS